MELALEFAKNKYLEEINKNETIQMVLFEMHLDN
jgi:hypothetical protein